MSGYTKKVRNWEVWVNDSKTQGYATRLSSVSKNFHFHVSSTRIVWDEPDKIPKYVKYAARLMVISEEYRSPTYKPAKYKLGEMVYSWQNPSKKRPITLIREARIGSGDSAKYKVSLLDAEGYSHSSKWINEGSLSKTKIR